MAIQTYNADNAQKTKEVGDALLHVADDQYKLLRQLSKPKSEVVELQLNYRTDFAPGQAELRIGLKTYRVKLEEISNAGG